MTTFTVTATAGGSTSNGMETALLVYTGQAATPVGATAGITSATPSVSITPNTTSDVIVGYVLSTASVAALSGTTYFENPNGGGLFFQPFHATATAGGTPQTVGGTGAASGISVVAAEIAGSAVLATQTLSGFVVATTVVSGSITPAAGSLLVLLVGSNGGAGATTMAVTDTSGLSLTWTEQVKQNGAGNGYTGVWTTVIPAAAVAAVVVTGDNPRNMSKLRLLGII